MISFRLIATLAITASAAHAQDPVLSPNAPRDRPVGAESASIAHLDSAMQTYIAQARATYPAAKARFLAGLPAGQSFFLTTRIVDGVGRFEQVFIAVDSIKGTTVYGRIWSEVSLVQGYRLRQPYSFPESKIVDWLITRPDGTEEGNYVGKFMDTYRPT